MINVHFGRIAPPIIGGISVYLYRLSKIEQNAIFFDEKNILVDDGININFLKQLFKFIIWYLKQFLRFKKRNFVVHSQTKEIRLLFYILACFSVHKFSLVIHSRTSLIGQYESSNRFFKILIRKILNKASTIQVIKLEYKTFLKSLFINNENIIVKNAFLPPPLEDEKKIIKSYKPEIIDFIKSKSPLIIANASFIRFYNNVDLYGFDLCVELTKKLKKDFPNLGFLFAISNASKELDYIKKIIKRIKELDIRENFSIMFGNKELWPIFKNANLMIRPTITDGDSISVREALYFHTPVIASDVTIRPKECVLFKNRNLESLYRNCINVLKGDSNFKDWNRVNHQ